MSEIPKFIFQRSKNQKLYLKVVATGVAWVQNPSDANSYTSRYAAKKHLRILDFVPAEVLLINMENA